MNETFWDAQNLEIEACANFDDFSGSGKIAAPEKIMGIGCSGLQGSALPYVASSRGFVVVDGVGVAKYVRDHPTLPSQGVMGRLPARV